MTHNFSDVLYLFSCGALGIEPVVDHELDVENIYKISCEQGIWGPVFISLKYLRAKGKINFPARAYDACEKGYLKNAVRHISRRSAIHSVMSELQKNGIQPYLLKGDIVSQYYSEPISRVSSDTDIFVGAEALNKAEKILQECGFTVKARSPMEHHSVCNHPVGGSVDLHLTFHDDCFEEKFFKGYCDITEPGVEYQIDEYKFLSLGVTDNAVFLFLHLVKHFLSCGTGIRQIMDFLLFWQNNRKLVNVELFKKMLLDLKFEELFNACVYIGIHYLQFDESVFDDFDITVDEFFVNWLLIDIENGGVFGKMDQRKLTFYYLFGDDAMSNLDAGKSTKLIKSYAKTFGYSYLSKKYPYAAKHKILVPVAFFHRGVDLCKSALRVAKTVKKANIQNDEMDNIKNRMDMIDTIYKK